MPPDQFLHATLVVYKDMKGRLKLIGFASGEAVYIDDVQLIKVD